jgi:hypothetical protein
VSGPTRHSLNFGFLNGFAIVFLALATSCGSPESSENGEPKPGALRIVRAVMTSLLSNSIEAREQDPAPASADAEAPGPPPPASASAPVAESSAELGTELGANAQVPQTCSVPYNGPVTIVHARSPGAFARSVDDRPRVRMVYETEDTAIWEDGRVLTTDVENLGTHLNAVGWASNPMQILGASARPGASGQNLGWDSATSSFTNSNKTKKRKKRRRRRG